MIGASRRRIVLAGSSKLGRTGLAPVRTLAEVDLLITGGEADPEIVANLRDDGTPVNLVDWWLVNVRSRGSLPHAVPTCGGRRWSGRSPAWSRG
ncbi:hypothetical protein SAMN05216276_1006243 [Streptosporangium subroseum]|uniref:Uncharacterized protein n=1 Tax=Streptosporangium subroseum TaxID=106412 RepID=A0A239D415_9ACTN|nr:hypothetical protein SAMN05216276_1006243 [Streptosporangium subroseum]